jgi:hypothetical protein
MVAAAGTVAMFAGGRAMGGLYRVEICSAPIFFWARDDFALAAI